MPKLFLSPPCILPWMSEDDVRSNILLLNLQGDLISYRKMRLDLDILFNPIPIRCQKLKTFTYYLGSTGAMVSIWPEDAEVTEMTPSAQIDVNYSNQVTRKRNSTVELVPKVKAIRGESEVEVTVGSLKHESGVEVSTQASFQGSERVLVCKNYVKAVEWLITQPRGEKVVRDYMVGNIPLFAEIEWSAQAKRKGKITAHTSDVLVFDNAHRPLPRKVSISMMFTIWRANRHLANRSGLTIEFELE